MPTKVELAGAARWCRDKFASWLATTWLYLILWTVVAITFGVLLYIDGKFSRSLAEGVEAIDPLSFQMMGWAYRLFAAAFLMAAARCAYKGIKGKWAFRWLGVFASIIVCLHAFGFGFEALSDRRDMATAKNEVVQVQAAGKADLIAALETRKTTIDTDTASAVATLDAEITQYITDGKNNDHLADDSRTRRNALQDKAAADKEGIDKEILALMREASDGKAEAVTTNATVKPWAPLFVGIAQLATWSKEPSDWAIYLCAIGFVIFWVLLGESLVIFLPERIYVMHLKDAEGRPVTAASEAVADGLHEVRMTDEELEAYEKHRKRSEAAALRARIPIEGKEAIAGIVGGIKQRHKTGASPQENYAASGFSTWTEYENFVNKFFNASAATKILGKGAPKPADPRAATPPESPVENGAEDVEDAAEDDPVIEDEPASEPEEAEPESDLFETETPEPDPEPEPEIEDEPEVTEPEASPERGLELWKPQPKDEDEDMKEAV